MLLSQANYPIILSIDKYIVSKMRLLSILLAAIVPLALCIYPDDHWQYSKQLTVENFDEVIKTEVDSGKTLFVRWIASAG